MTTSDSQIVVPFLKWAGGKRWLIAQRPDLFNVPFVRYVEPFLGSGAVFFHLAPKRALLADLNATLVETYTAVRDDWTAVASKLRKRANLHDDAFYYEERGKRYASATTRAAQFIYLNRTCWNGLYRVNLDGEFNVPRGTKDSVLLPSDDFEATADALKSATIRCEDFEQTLARAKKGDLVFVDPPYTVRHNLNGFVKYNENIFSWEDQERLRDAIDDAASRGARCIVTNANHASIRSLYKGFGKHSVVERISKIAADGSKRTATSELIIVV